MKRKFGGAPKVSNDELRLLIATLYDIMQRNNFAHFSRAKRTEFLEDYVHGHSEAAKVYPEMMEKFESTKSNLSQFIHFLEDLSLDESSRVNHWLIPPIYPANGCDNPYIVDIESESTNGMFEGRDLTMSEIQSKAIQVGLFSEKSCRTCVMDRHGPIDQQNGISYLKQNRYRPTTCVLRPLNNHVSGFRIHITTNLKKVIRVQSIELSGKMKQQLLRLSSVRDLEVVSKLNAIDLLKESASYRNDCFIELEFNMPSISAPGSEQIWSRAGYQSIIKKKTNSEVVTPDEIFSEVKDIIESVGDTCNPTRHSDIGSLFKQYFARSSHGNDFWPPLYVKCNPSILEKIRDVALNRGGKVGEEYKQVPFLLDEKMKPNRAEIAIDPIAFWM